MSESVKKNDNFVLSKNTGKGTLGIEKHKFNLPSALTTHSNAPLPLPLSCANLLSHLPPFASRSFAHIFFPRFSVARFSLFFASCVLNN